MGKGSLSQSRERCGQPASRCCRSVVVSTSQSKETCGRPAFDSFRSAFASISHLLELCDQLPSCPWNPAVASTSTSPVLPGQRLFCTFNSPLVYGLQRASVGRPPFELRPLLGSAYFEPLTFWGVFSIEGETAGTVATFACACVPYFPTLLMAGVPLLCVVACVRVTRRLPPAIVFGLCHLRCANPIIGKGRCGWVSEQ